MDNTIVKVFESNQFGDLRVVMDEHGEPWFVAKDVCEFLEITNRNRAMQQLDEDEKGGTHMSTPGGEQYVATVNEAGLYRLLLTFTPSKANNATPEQEEARKLKVARIKGFQRWVTHEVLPVIRRTGGYVVARDDETPEELMARALKAADEALQRRDKRIAEMRPKEIFADAVSTSHTSILVGELAKLLKQNGYVTGQNRLFRQLRDEGFLMKGGSSKNMPTQHSMELGLFEVKETTITNPDGTIRVTKTPKVTGKGQVYFVNRYCGEADDDDLFA